ncbi:TPA: glycosyltransferase family 2 protein [Pseudomonas aeruginosa]
MSELNIILLAGGKAAIDAQRNTGEYPDFLTEHGSTTLLETLINKCADLNPKKIICLFSSADTTKYHLRNLVSQLSPVASVIPVHDKTMGAACTALLASGEVDNDEELLIMGSNEYLDVSLETIVSNFRAVDAKAGVVTFNSIHPRYSFVRLDDRGDVIESTEKNPISKNAIAGTFWFKRGKHFVSAAKNLIRKDTKVDESFYIAPALNELVLSGLRIASYKIDAEQYHPLKSPTQIQAYEMGATR